MKPASSDPTGSKCRAASWASYDVSDPVVDLLSRWRPRSVLGCGYRVSRRLTEHGRELVAGFLPRFFDRTSAIAPLSPNLSFDHERANGAHKVFFGDAVLDERDDFVGPTR